MKSLHIQKFIYTESLYIEKNNLTSQSYPLSEMSRNLLKMKAVPGNTAFCKQLMTMGIPMVLRWFSSFSLTLPKAPTTIGITVALTSHNFCTCNLKSWYMVIFLDPSLWCFDLQESYVHDFAISLLFIDDCNIWSLVFYFFMCLDWKVPKYFTFVIFQHWLWLMREPFVFTFNLRFLAQELIVSLPVLISS